MSFAQVVRLTRCETTTGYPALLREMAMYLGFRFHPGVFGRRDPQGVEADPLLSYCRYHGGP